MSPTNAKAARRRIMQILYDSFLHDPLQMMSPSDMVDEGGISITELVPNAHYLHDRNLIELMMGYNPPLFAATRISPEGIDLIEDRPEFERMFPHDAIGAPVSVGDIVELVTMLVREAEECALEGRRREWLLGDIDALRHELVAPEASWRSDVIMARLDWMDGFFENDDVLPSLDKLRTALIARLK